MNISVLGDILQIVGSLCFFVFGMKMMSDGIQRAAGSQMRNILRTMTKNRYLGVLTGFLITALLQSSSATTVMTVSFVNAGLLSLVESAGVMMGANIGTTITGWLVSILGFKVKLSLYSIPLFAFAVPMIFSNNNRFKYWGEFLAGFAILFLGLSYLKDAVPTLKDNSEALAFLGNFTDWGIFSRLFFVFVGTLVTIIVQSSSAAMAITLTMCSQGWLPFDVATAMILGENIGTTITAELASLVGNVNAKRSARIHSLFNVIGVTWMVIILPYFVPILSNLTNSLLGTTNIFEATDMPIGLSAFHTAFNLLNVLILLPFVPWLVRLAEKSVKPQEEEDEAGLKFISNSSLTPELATIELQKEAAHFGEIVSRMSAFTNTLISDIDLKKKKKALKKISKYEKISDQMEIEITDYITKLADKEITPKTSMRLRSFLNIANDLERIADIYYQISMTIERKDDNRTYFLPEQRQGLQKMNKLLDKAFSIMINNLSKPNYDKVSKSEAQAIEDEINSLRDSLKESNLSKLGGPDYPVESAMIFNNIFSAQESIGDHILNVSKSVAGEI